MDDQPQRGDSASTRALNRAWMRNVMIPVMVAAAVQGTFWGLENWFDIERFESRFGAAVEHFSPSAMAGNFEHRLAEAHGYRILSLAAPFNIDEALRVLDVKYPRGAARSGLIDTSILDPDKPRDASLDQEIADYREARQAVEDSALPDWVPSMAQKALAFPDALIFMTREMLRGNRLGIAIGVATLVICAMLFNAEPQIIFILPFVITIVAWLLQRVGIVVSTALDVALHPLGARIIAPQLTTFSTVLGSVSFRWVAETLAEHHVTEAVTHVAEKEKLI